MLTKKDWLCNRLGGANFDAKRTDSVIIIFCESFCAILGKNSECRPFSYYTTTFADGEYIFNFSRGTSPWRW